MQAPPTPIDETQRLRSLATLCILDTVPEERFDRITRLACRAFGVPIALVSLVDRERQWFKSKQGLDACETARDISLCGHAILHESPLVVRDTLQDERFRDNPLVTGGPHIRFYAGHPIHGPDGSRVGTLCLIDRQPCEFDAGDASALADFAAMVDRELALLDRAATDELTSLLNRRGFATVAQRIIALCRRNQQCAVVVGIDLDNFKSVNEDFGHDAGDRALRMFGKLLTTHFRESDAVARRGGDELRCCAVPRVLRKWPDRSRGWPAPSRHRRWRATIRNYPAATELPSTCQILAQRSMTCCGQRMPACTTRRPKHDEGDSNAEHLGTH
jgi:GAF domain-containing protein